MAAAQSPGGGGGREPARENSRESNGKWAVSSSSDWPRCLSVKERRHAESSFRGVIGWVYHQSGEAVLHGRLRAWIGHLSRQLRLQGRSVRVGVPSCSVLSGRQRFPPLSLRLGVEVVPERGCGCGSPGLVWPPLPLRDVKPKRRRQRRQPLGPAACPRTARPGESGDPPSSEMGL